MTSCHLEFTSRNSLVYFRNTSPFTTSLLKFTPTPIKLIDMSRQKMFTTPTHRTVKENIFPHFPPLVALRSGDSLKAGKFVQFALWPVFDILIQKRFYVQFATRAQSWFQPTYRSSIVYENICAVSVFMLLWICYYFGRILFD